MDHYIEKVKKFNEKDNYKLDIRVANMLIKNHVSNKQKTLYIIGTGLGEDLEVAKNITGLRIIGLEPRPTFQEIAAKKYKKFGYQLLKEDLGQFVKSSKSTVGFFLFMHSFNHIPYRQIKALEKILKKDSYIIIINPNPMIEKIKGKTDKTAIRYLNSEKISKMLNSQIIFDFFYNPKPVKYQKIPIREALLLKK